MKANLLLFGMVAVLLASAGCGGRRSSIGADEFGLESDAFSVRFENDRFEDAQVYIRFQAGQRRRLGTVTGKTASTFSVSYRPVEFVVVVNFTGGGRSQATRSTHVSRGDVLVVRAPVAGQLIVTKR